MLKFKRRAEAALALGVVARVVPRHA